ncbi:helix-turn-helix transcriptional regulator, partial [Gordonibacter sp.]
MELNEKLKALRQERGMTQEQVAAKLYVSRTAVSKW